MKWQKLIEETGPGWFDQTEWVSIPGGRLYRVTQGDVGNSNNASYYIQSITFVPSQPTTKTDENAPYVPLGDGKKSSDEAKHDWQYDCASIPVFCSKCNVKQKDSQSEACERSEQPTSSDCEHEWMKARLPSEKEWSFMVCDECSLEIHPSK